jgi:hypothetical protein
MDRGARAVRPGLHPRHPSTSGLQEPADEMMLALVDALARQAAREEYERLTATALDLTHETCRPLRPIFDRPPERTLG